MLSCGHGSGCEAVEVTELQGSRSSADRHGGALLKAFHRITYRDTLVDMAQAISVRLDDEALRALGQLEATGMSRSEAIRTALVETAARRNDKQILAAEVAALEADEDDRAEMLAVADLMERMRAPR
jgi:Arc/MetJ-type ribon-helix-helix transcriptional regulator